MLYNIFIILAIVGTVFAGKQAQYVKQELDGTSILLRPSYTQYNGTETRRCTPGAEELAVYPNRPIYNSTYYPYGYGALTNVLRHGDRTPDAEELAVYPNRPIYNSTYYPYGYGALTNIGKRRAYSVGEYLRGHFKGWLSRVYLPEEVVIRTTSADRAKMTALVALAALYKPERIQQWNRGMNLDLEWQPVPYTFLPSEVDDLEYTSSCPAYVTLLNTAVHSLSVDTASEYADTYALLTKYTGYNVTDPSTVLDLQTVVLAQESYGVQRAEWYTELEDQIKAIVDYNSGVLVSSDSMKRLSGGVLLSEFLDASSLIVAGEEVDPTLTIYSSHEVNVIAALGVSRAFNNPHRPGFGATFSLELRQNTTSGGYGFAVVYATMDGQPAEVIRIDGCGDVPLCPYDTFLQLTANYTITRKDWLTECAA